MAPASDIPVVQFIQFHANDRCLADPSLFQAVRDIAQGWQEKGLKAQYWGTSVNRASEFYWLLVWRSHVHATAIKIDPSYSTFVQDRDALVTAPVYEVHVRFSGNPQRTLEAPVTEVDYYKTDDSTRPSAETQDMVRRVTYRMESLQMPGFIALSWGVSFEDGTRAVYLGGWRSVEDHMRLGMLDDHKVFVEEIEEIFKGFKELSVTHVHFNRHSAQPLT